MKVVAVQFQLAKYVLLNLIFHGHLGHVSKMRAFLGKHDRLVHGLWIWYPKSGIAERSALFPFEQEVP